MAGQEKAADGELFIQGADQAGELIRAFQNAVDEENCGIRTRVFSKKILVNRRAS